MSVSLSDWKSRDFLESASPDDLEQCLSEGADPNVRIEDGETPLHVVGTREGVELLLDAGADPNARDETGQTPLHAAARDSECTPEEVELLFDAGADPSA
ncbi:MAG: hypothetical protein F4Z73_04565 [Synechococcus sp. SB0668_bin_13]|nr:hypothetical protein [Synechococcus sp. SB0668_bin_13]